MEGNICNSVLFKWILKVCPHIVEGRRSMITAGRLCGRTLRLFPVYLTVRHPSILSGFRYVITRVFLVPITHLFHSQIARILNFRSKLRIQFLTFHNLSYKMSNDKISRINTLTGWTSLRTF
jgi:hypothetical protein